MLSVSHLYEQKEKPFRPRAEIFILKGRKLIVGQPQKGWSGYIIPGGGIDRGEKPIDAAQREALEELGVKAKNIKVYNKQPKRINYSPVTPHMTNPKMIDYINKLNAKYSGAEFYSFIGEFDGFDKSLWGKNIDTYKAKEIDILSAIRFFMKHANDMKKIEDYYNQEKALYVVEILKSIK
jgi:8-oxo-dGTP pyrophosphatase MutT (NUDIX family)